MWNWEDLRLSGREVCRMIFFWRTAGENIWEFRTIDVKVRRFEHMCVCESEGVRVWRWENLQMWRGHKIKKKGVKMRGWDYVRNWKCEVKNINRKVTVCKNVLYIKIIAKEKQSNQVNDTRIHIFCQNASVFFVEGQIDFRNLNEDNFKYASVMQSETLILQNITPATPRAAASWHQHLCSNPTAGN